MKKQQDAIRYLDPTSEEKKQTSEGGKSRHEIRVEKHSRLLKYMENKRLKEELEFIDKW